MSNPEPIDSMIYPRYSGIATFMRLPHLTDTSQLDVAFVGVPFDTAAGYRVGARLAGQVQLVVLVHQLSRNAQFSRLDALDLLAVPLDEALHGGIARQHERQDGHGALAHHICLDLTFALSFDPSLGRRSEALAELLW